VDDDAWGRAVVLLPADGPDAPDTLELPKGCRILAVARRVGRGDRAVLIEGPGLPPHHPGQEPWTYRSPAHFADGWIGGTPSETVRLIAAREQLTTW
jgi:hypothetical protein